MTIVVRILGGRHATIEAPMLIFSNENRSYSIWDLLDDVPIVSYRMDPKDRMDQTIFSKCFLESCAYQAYLHQCMKIIWLGNCSDHAMTPRLVVVLAAKNTISRFLPPCSTNICQPTNTFFI